MSLNNIIFTENLPKIDLHGYDSMTAKMLINDFINEQVKLKNEVVIIIHGNGSGILRKTTNETLRKHKNVIEHKTSFFNRGCTLVALKFDK